MHRTPYGYGEGAGLFYYHYDGLGSVAALSDVNGTVVESYEYDVFGEPTIYDYAAHQMVEESSVGNPYMFTGRRLDPETDLYYYRARYYAPEIGRFLQTDPIYYAGGLNLYTYCGNNPLNWIDPWGLCKDDVGDPTLNDWIRELSKAFFEGAKDGLEIAANEYSFGLTDHLDLTDAATLVERYGTAGEASRFLAARSRDALLAAGLMKASGWNVKMGKHPPHHGQGPHLQINWWKTGVKGSGGRWSWP